MRVDRHATLFVKNWKKSRNTVTKPLICSIIDNTNSQSRVADADPEAPTLKSLDNGDNLANLVSGFIRLPSSWDLSVFIGDR